MRENLGLQRAAPHYYGRIARRRERGEVADEDHDLPPADIRARPARLDLIDQFSKVNTLTKPPTSYISISNSEQ